MSVCIYSKWFKNAPGSEQLTVALGKPGSVGHGYVCVPIKGGHICPDKMSNIWPLQPMTKSPACPCQPDRTAPDLWWLI